MQGGGYGGGYGGQGGYGGWMPMAAWAQAQGFAGADQWQQQMQAPEGGASGWYVPPGSEGGASGWYVPPDLRGQAQPAPAPPGSIGGKAGGKGGNSKGSGGYGGEERGSRNDKANKNPAEMTLDEYNADKAKKAAERKEKLAKQQEEAKAAAKARAEAFERGELEPAPAPPPPTEVARQEMPTVSAADAAASATAAKPAVASEKVAAEPAPVLDEPVDDWEAAVEKVEVPPPEEKKPAAPVEKAAAVAVKKESPPSPQAVPTEAPAVAAKPQPERKLTKEADDEEEVEVKRDAEPGSLKSPDPRPHFNVVFIGHVDAGKSTTCGNILYLSGMVDERTIEKYKQEASTKAGESWFLAFIMDTGEEEKAKGKTVEVGRAAFETQNRRFTILDAPGHKSYVPNMIAGASAADVGVLLISARKGEFETGFEKGGQTCEHAMLAKTLGIDKLIVAINKMDDPTVEWDKGRYDDIQKKLGAFLKKSGYKEDQVIYLPISGLWGDNIKERKRTPSWYEGKTLLETFDSLCAAGRKSDGPLRIPMMEGFKDMGSVMALGKVESGTVKPGMKCIVMPTMQKCTVMDVYLGDDLMSSAPCGENVTMRMTGISDEELKKGYVLCDIKYPCPVITKFKAKIHLIELGSERPVLTCGYQAIMHAHTVSEECEILKLYETMPLATKKTEKNPQFARIDSVVTCSIKLARPTALDSFANAPQLGRFTLRDEGRTIAIGKITELPKSSDGNKESK